MTRVNYNKKGLPYYLDREEEYDLDLERLVLLTDF